MKPSILAAALLLAAMPACAEPAVPELKIGAAAVAAQAAAMLLSGKDSYYTSTTIIDATGVTASGGAGPSGSAVFISTRPGTRPVSSGDGPLAPGGAAGLDPAPGGAAGLVDANSGNTALGVVLTLGMPIFETLSTDDTSTITTSTMP